MSLPETVEVHKLTVPEFHALFPFLDPDRRHELLDGVIFTMSPLGKPHVLVWRRLLRRLLSFERPGLWVWEGHLILSETYEPWPDLALLSQEPEALPGEDNPPVALAKLVIEVSDTSLRGDTRQKLRAYQAAGVPEYWVLDVRGRLLRHVAPDYQAQPFAAGDTLSPQAYPDVSIAVGALFAS